MSTIPVPDPQTRKKIMFYDTPERQAQLKIQCAHDGLKQSEFFRLVVEGYISSDPRITEFLHACKEKYSFQGRDRRNKDLKLKNQGRQNIKDFALDDSDISNIFDILESDI